MLCRVLAPGRHGGDAVDIRRSDHTRARLVTNCVVWRSVTGRRTGSTVLGRALDRSSARLVLCIAMLLTGTADMLLSLTSSLLMLYLLFCGHG
jgi:hypothetical protein